MSFFFFLNNWIDIIYIILCIIESRELGTSRRRKFRERTDRQAGQQIAGQEAKRSKLRLSMFLKSCSNYEREKDKSVNVMYCGMICRPETTIVKEIAQRDLCVTCMHSNECFDNQASRDATARMEQMFITRLSVSMTLRLCVMRFAFYWSLDSICRNASKTVHIQSSSLIWSFRLPAFVLKWCLCFRNSPFFLCNLPATRNTYAQPFKCCRHT